MNIQISFKHLEHTPALDKRIREKSQRIEKYLEHLDVVTLKWACTIKGNRHHTELDLFGPHFRYHSHATSDSLYKTFDMVIHKMERQLLKKKESWKNKMHRQKGHLTVVGPEMAWDEHEDYYDDDLKKAA